MLQSENLNQYRLGDIVEVFDMKTGSEIARENPNCERLASEFVSSHRGIPMRVIEFHEPYVILRISATGQKVMADARLMEFRRLSWDSIRHLIT